MKSKGDTPLAHTPPSNPPQRKNSQLRAWMAICLLFLPGCMIVETDDFGDARNTDFIARESFTYEVNISGQTRVTVEAINGTIEILGSATASSVIVTGERKVGSDTFRDAEEHLDDLEVRVTDLNDEVLVRTIQPQQSHGRNYVVEYTITLPSDLMVDVSQINGTIIIEDLQQDVVAHSVNGTVRLDDIVGSANISVVNGNVDGDIALPADGLIELKATNGNIKLAIPTSTSATFSASVTNGDIDTTNLTFQNPVSSNRSLSGRLGGGNSTIDLRTVNGNIRVNGVQ
ncbi:MAG: DUF4097 domain-containing protein [Rhodothermales bacterium]